MLSSFQYSHFVDLNFWFLKLTDFSHDNKLLSIIELSHDKTRWSAVICKIKVLNTKKSSSSLLKKRLKCSIKCRHLLLASKTQSYFHWIQNGWPLATLAVDFFVLIPLIVTIGIPNSLEIERNFFPFKCIVSNHQHSIVMHFNLYSCHNELSPVEVYKWEI